MNLIELPDDMLLLLCQTLEIQDLFALMLCCKKLSSIAQDERVWKHLCLYDDLNIQEKKQDQPFKSFYELNSNYEWDKAFNNYGRWTINPQNRNQVKMIEVGNTIIFTKKKLFHQTRKYSWFVKFDWEEDSWDRQIGIGTREQKTDILDNYLGAYPHSISLQNDGSILSEPTLSSQNIIVKKEEGFRKNDIIQIKIENRKIYWYVNNNLIAEAGPIDWDVDLYPSVYLYCEKDAAILTPTRIMPK